jgi:hypothetical protein
VFTLIVTTATGVLFALAPIVESRVSNLRAVLGNVGASATSKSTRIDAVLVAAEVALALMLLAGAALMTKSLWQLQDYPAGFSPKRSYTMRVPLTGPRYEAFGQKVGFINELLGRLEATPGVEAAGISASTYHLPLRVHGQVASSEPSLVAVRMVSPGYLRAMGVSLVRGRWPRGRGVRVRYRQPDLCSDAAAGRRSDRQVDRRLVRERDNRRYRGRPLLAVGRESCTGALLSVPARAVDAVDLGRGADVSVGGIRRSPARD